MNAKARKMGKRVTVPYSLLASGFFLHWMNRKLYIPPFSVVKT